MAYQSPFFEGTQAQGIINNYLNNMPGGLPPYTTPSTNPYLVDSTPFVPPAAQPTPDPTVPNCEELYPGEGRVYDPVLQACVIAEVAPEEATGDSSDDQSPEEDPNKNSYNNMLKDTGTIFGASNFLDDYVIDSPNGDILLKFDPNINKSPLFYGLGDAIFGGEGRRAKKFLDSVQTYQNTGDGQYLNDGTYQVYNPQQYFDSVQGNQLQSYGYGSQPNINVGQAVDSVMNPQPQVYDPLTGTNRSSNANASSGSPIAEDMSGGLLGRSPLTSVDSQGNRTRNDTAYRASVARNIERNKRNFGNSKFKEGVGFMGGR